MAKVIMPPQISSLDELLDIVVHPEKFAARLTQMIEVRDAITSKLALLDVVEQADAHLSQAQDSAAKTVASAKLVHESAAQEAQHAAAKTAQLQKDQDAWTKAKDAEQEFLKQRADELNAAQSRVDAKSAELMAREVKLNEQDAVLARLAAKLTAEQEKMHKRKELLNAI